MSPARVCVVGLGYVGLPAAVVLAGAGHAVLGVDIDPAVRAAVGAGRSPIAEPEVERLLRAAITHGRVRVAAAPEPADAFIIAVPTPISGLAHKRADLGAVMAAVEAVAAVLRPGNLVILESTVPPGTTERAVRPLIERCTGLHAGADFLLAHCPERVLPGRIVHELVHESRVIGGVDHASATAARDLYSSFAQGAMRLTDATTAELVKLMENTYRDVNIALANEFALVSEQLGVDVWEAIDLANQHPRVQFLRPGPGVGGHCIAVDPWFVAGAAPGFTPLIAAGRAVNDRMPCHVTDLVADALGDLRDRRVLALGVTYKADVDDTRESPSMEVIEHLRRAGTEVRVHDAMVAADTPIEQLAEGVDCLLLLVDHGAYAALNPGALAPRMRRRVAVDARNALPPAPWLAAGFTLVRLGDGSSRQPATGSWQSQHDLDPPWIHHAPVPAYGDGSQGA